MQLKQGVSCTGAELTQICRVLRAGVYWTPLDVCPRVLVTGEHSSHPHLIVEFIARPGPRTQFYMERNCLVDVRVQLILCVHLGENNMPRLFTFIKSIHVKPTTHAPPTNSTPRPIHTS